MRRILTILLLSLPLIGQSKISDNQIRTPPPLQCSDTSGSGTTQSCTTSPSFTPAAKDCITYNTTTTNTGALTLNVNSQGAKAVQKWLGSALVAGDVVANKPQYACYDGTNWQVMTIGNAPSAGGVTSITCGTGITCSASPITSTGTINVSTPSPYNNLANTNGSSDTLSATGNYATTASLASNSLNKGSVIDIWFSGTEHVQSGCNFQYGIVIDSTTIYTDIGHSSATGDFFVSGHWRFVVIATGASGTILQNIGTGESVVNQSNGGASNPFGYSAGSSTSTTLDTTASHTIKVHGGGTYANSGTTTLVHLTVTQLN